MQKNKSLYVIFALISACTASLPPATDHAKPLTTTSSVIKTEKATSHPLESLFGRETNKDEALFLQGLRQLFDQVDTNAAGNAKDTLGRLISDYPQSKWRNAAAATLRLMGEVDDYHHRLIMEQDTIQKLIVEKNQAIRENEQLKKDLRLLNEKYQAGQAVLQKDLRLQNEKYQADQAALQQENEQLKKDLQLLKDLELQLDKRGKTLR